jgi:Concanavalin A-like lectin/glucanases superfamily/Fibronectin type III domain
MNPILRSAPHRTLAAMLLAFSLVACPSPTPPTPPAPPPPAPGTVPAKPTEFTQTAPTATTLTLNWKLVTGATGYILERKTASTAFAQIATPNATTNTYTDTGLTLGTTYTYSLKATNANGSSDAVTLDATPSAGGADSDGDTISDADELAGWDVSITRGGTQISTRKVTSNPAKPDSDDDGLNDAQERQRFTDPTRADTDADGLGDPAEVSTWASNPADVDTDNDAQGNSALYDGNELTVHGTSPTLPDSDGDQISDYREIIELGGVFKPLVANTPRFELSFATAPSVTVDIGQTGSSTVTSSQSSSLALSNATSRSSTDTQTQRFNAEISATVGASVEAGTGGVNTSVSASVTATVGYGFESTNSYTNESSQATERSAAEAREQSSVTGFELKGGRLTVGVKVKNVGDVAFTLANLGITALRRDPSNPQSFLVVGGMTFDAGSPTSLTLSPNETSGTLALSLNLAGNLAQTLMENPSSLKFEFSGYDVNNADGRNFKFQNDTTNAQTALVVLDYGNGHTTRARVATNVERTNGQIVGVKLGKVLKDILNLQFVTETNTGGVKVLRSVFDPTVGTNALVTSSPSDKTVWVVVGTNGLAIGSSTNFEDIVLKAGSELRVMLARDFDGDKLPDSEEFFYGTSDNNADTDGDTLSDFLEVRTGWTVTTTSAVTGYPRVVYPNPTTTDSDLDTLSDKTEQMNGTDPRSDDTDRDGTPDAADPQPLNPGVGANVAPTVTNVNSTVTGSTVTLTATVTDTNLTGTVINWGDGTSTPLTGSAAQNVNQTHTYTSSSNYTVTITATDAGGLTGTATRTVNILDITSGRLLELLFDNNTSDSSGSNKNATISNVACAFLTADRSSVLNKAFKLNQDFGSAGCGADYVGYLSTANIPFASVANPNFSFSLWLKPNIQGNDMWVMGQSNNGGSAPWARFFIGSAQDGAANIGSSNRLSFVIPGSTRLLLTDATALTNSGAWVHYVVTVSHSAGVTTARLYKNGALATLSAGGTTATTTVLYTNPSTTNPFYVGDRCGGSSNSGCERYSGSVDNIRIYNRALAANEVQALFTETN